MEPETSSISSTFGLADVVNNSVSSAWAEGGSAIRHDRNRANHREGFFVFIVNVLRPASLANTSSPRAPARRSRRLVWFFGRPEGGGPPPRCGTRTRGPGHCA